MKNGSKGLVGLTAALVLIATSYAVGGPLLTTDDHAIQGSVDVDDPGVPGFDTTVDFAVFATGIDFQQFADDAFGAGTYTIDAALDDQYVYAYQLHVDSSATNGINRLGVGFDSFDTVTGPWYLSGSGDVDPTTVNLATSAVWGFAFSPKFVSGSSAILYFASPDPWETDNVNVVNYSGANTFEFAVPSPLPEPAAVVLLSAGILIIARRRRHRNAT